MPRRTMIAISGLLGALLLLASCAPSAKLPRAKKTLVVTYSILGSLVQELVGDQFSVVVALPNGLDPHEWEPSAKAIETFNQADLIIRNGLGLEGGMEKALARAQAAGVPVFTASDHIRIRTVKAGQGIPSGDPDQAPGAQDPHLWTDPKQMQAILKALASELQSRFGTDLSVRAADLEQRLDALNRQIQGQVDTLPPAQRRLVTGHESLGYFAEAFGFRLVGAIIPSLTDQAEVSAADLSALKKTIQTQRVSTIFTEQGTPPRVAEALSREMNLRVVEITTHRLPADGSYFTFLRALADTILSALRR